MTKLQRIKQASAEHPRILRIKHVAELTGLSQSYLYHLSSIGKFPKSIPIVPGGMSKGWIDYEIHEWIQQRINDRDLEV